MHRRIGGVSRPRGTRSKRLRGHRMGAQRRPTPTLNPSGSCCRPAWPSARAPSSVERKKMMSHRSCPSEMRVTSIPNASPLDARPRRLLNFNAARPAEQASSGRIAYAVLRRYAPAGATRCASQINIIKIAYPGHLSASCPTRRVLRARIAVDPRPSPRCPLSTSHNHPPPPADLQYAGAIELFPQVTPASGRDALGGRRPV